MLLLFLLYLFLHFFHYKTPKVPPFLGSYLGSQKAPTCRALMKVKVPVQVCL